MKKFPITQYSDIAPSSLKEAERYFYQLDEIIEHVVDSFLPDLNEAIDIGHAFACRNNLIVPIEFTAKGSIQVPAQDSKYYFYTIRCNLSFHNVYQQDRDRYIRKIAKGDGRQDNTTIYFLPEFADTKDGKRLISYCKLLLALDEKIRQCARIIVSL